jgi:hypothetical protein
LYAAPLVLAARFLGGFCTTSDWLFRADAAHATPDGFFFPGLWTRELYIWLSPAVDSDLGCRCFREIIQALAGAAKSKLCVLGTSQELSHEHGRYTALRGDKARPASQIVAVARDDSDAERIRAGECKDEPQLVRSLREFLDTFCKPVPSIGCPGRWAH